MSQKRQPRGIPVGGEFAPNAHDESAVGLPLDLSSQEPDQIDGELAELYYEDFRQESIIRSAEERIRAGERRRQGLSQKDRDYYGQKIREAAAERDRIAREMEPFHEEYESRGGWERAFLVTGLDGHVHSSTGCSTCNRMGKRTRFMWMTKYSGKSQEEIIDAAGSGACTVCYPDAPVETLNRPSRIVDPEYEAEKAKRAEEKAIRDAAAAEKAISDPDTGDRLVVDGYHIKTSVTAEREAVDRMLTLKVNSVREYPNTEYAESRKPALRKIVYALSRKRGETTEETTEYLETKAARKFKKDYGWVLDDLGATEVPATPDFW